MVTVTRKGSQTMEEVRKALLIEIGLGSINDLVTEKNVTFKELNELLEVQHATALKDYIKIKEINAEEIESDPYIQAFKEVPKTVSGNLAYSNSRKFTKNGLAKYEEDQRDPGPLYPLRNNAGVR